MSNRSYTLSEAAMRQRKAASEAAKRKRIPRHLKGIATPSAPQGLATAATLTVTAEDPATNTIWLSSDLVDIFAPLPKDAPNSAHQSRAALIRQHRIKTGEISGSSVGGRRKVARFCPQCGSEQPGAREAQNHCRVARKGESA